MVVDAELFNKECLTLTGQPFSDLRYSQRIRIKSQTQQWLVQLILQMMEKLKKQSLQLSIQQQELLEKQLIEQLLLSIHPPAGKNIRIPNRLQVAHKAEQLIRQNVHKHLTVEQLCKLIGCAPRTLHLGFKERYGTTPIKYGRALALNAVWKQLYSISFTETITDVAMACGFYHLGRFSQQYKQLFNELPSLTVERGKELTL
jgi:AraC family ethanolamine operon transcriptional activator